MSDNDRRLAIVRIPQSTVLDWFQVALDSDTRFIHIPVIAGLPDKCKVCSVHYDFMSRSFAFTVQHESFDEVQDGHEIPVVYPEGFSNQYRCVEVKTPEPECPVIVHANVD